MNLQDYPPMVRPIRVIDSRLSYHCSDGGLLSGLTYDREGKYSARGKKDLPFIQPVAFSDIETIGPGSNLSMSKSNVQGNSPAMDEQTFSFFLFVRRDYGWYQSNTSESRYGVMDWVAKVRDAVEYTAEESPKVDRRLEKTISEPIQSLVSQNEITELSWAVLLEFIVRTDTYCAGGRFSVD